MKRRNKRGQGAYAYKERRVYFEQCSRCPRRYQTYHKGNIRKALCGNCRRAERKISPGQEPLFGADLAQGKDQTVITVHTGEGRPA